MKKLFATSLLLMCFFVGFANNTAGAVENPSAPVCHDKSGKWNPENKNCDPYSCGCLFHQIEEFFVDLFS